MSILLKLQWDIAQGREADFHANQEALCSVMHDHPGVISYHAEYPSPRVSRWTEVFANDDAFEAHLANKRGQEPLSALIADCDHISCECWGTPSESTKKVLANFGATYHDTAANSFVLNPRADRESLV